MARYEDNNRRYRESDSYERDTDGSFSGYLRDERDYLGLPRRAPPRDIGRFRGVNRFGEDHIMKDEFEDELGMNRWPDDNRSEASYEDHSGKGPKGYRRSREKILNEAFELLRRDYYLDASDIEIEIQGEALVLKGEVETRRDKRRAEVLVEAIPGIEDVHNQLTIRSHKSVSGWVPGVKDVDIDEARGRSK